MKHKRLIILCAAILLTLACGLPSLPTATAPEAVDNPPTEVVIQESGILFEDDFDSRDGPWRFFDDADKIIEYARGGLRFWVGKAQWDIWSNIGTPFEEDVIIEVDATKLAGPDANDFGIICKYTKAGTEDDPLYSFYSLLITSDGYVAILRYLENNIEYITPSGNLEGSAAILTGNATNHIRADCFDNYIALYVNDTLALSVEDNAVSYGSVGLVAGTFDETGTDILFDNFVVKRP